MTFLILNYSCLQNPWLGGYRPHSPVLSVLNWICCTSPFPLPNKIPGYATACSSKCKALNFLAFLRGSSQGHSKCRNRKLILWVTRHDVHTVEICAVTLSRSSQECPNTPPQIWQTFPTKPAKKLCFQELCGWNWHWRHLPEPKHWWRTKQRKSKFGSEEKWVKSLSTPWKHVGIWMYNSAHS